jgi:lipoate-protein ligase A
MAEEFGKLVGPLEPFEMDQELRATIDELRARMVNEEWLHQKGKRVAGRDVKIRAGVKVVHKTHKAPGGLIRADYEVRENRFSSVSLSGDFFCFPEQAISWMESRLDGQLTEKVLDLLTDFYSETDVETPGISLDDWMMVLKV